MIRADLSRRLVWLDQCRGYAILAMVFVNVTNLFVSSPWWLKHHRFVLSYNDTIAPLFIFLAGLGFRMTFARHTGQTGLARARFSAARRYVLLTAIGAVIYMGYFWDALTDIGLSGLLALPVIHCSGRVRACAALACLAAYQAILSFTPYGPWVMASSINGGPLGVLAWCAMLLCGTLVWDWLSAEVPGRFVQNSTLAGLMFVVLGATLRLPWPGLKAAWPYSQFGMSISYAALSIGFCFFTVLFFERLCGRFGARIPALSIFGKNPLAVYLFHWALILPAERFMPASAGWPLVFFFALTICAACYLFARLLDWRGIVVKL